MWYWQIVTLRAHRSSKSAAEWINYGRKATQCFIWSTEAKCHELLGVVGQQTEFLLACHGIIACTKKFTGDSCIVKRLCVLTSGWVTDIVGLVRNMTASWFECHGLELGLTFTVCSVSKVYLLLVLLARAFHLGMLDWWQLVVTLTLSLLVHHTFDRLFWLSLRFALVDWRVHDVSVDALELAVFDQVDFNVGVLV